MNQLTDSTSDSDSNSSTSWVFVDESNAQNQEANKYYLNCSSEPVQELTEKCLNSAGSEIETDSDGISVISESDSDKQSVQNDLGNSSEEIEKETEKEVIETVCDSTIELGKIIKPMNMYHENCNSLIWYVMLASVLVLAVMPLFLSDDELIVNDSLSDCDKKVDDKLCEYDLDVDEVIFNHITPLGYCQTDKSEIYIENSKTVEDVKADESSELKRQYNHNYRSRKPFEKRDSKKNEKIYSNRKIKFNEKKHCNDYKDNNYKTKRDECKNHQYYDKEIKKRQNQLEELEKSFRKKEKELNEMKRQLKNLKIKISKELNFLQALKKRKYKENKKRFNKEKHLLNMRRFNVSSTGDWYNNLYNERDKVRRQEQMANWIFDRAEMRSKKRDKAVWYFNWMTNREQLRFKKEFKQFAY